MKNVKTIEIKLKTNEKANTKARTKWRQRQQRIFETTWTKEAMKKCNLVIENNGSELVVAVEYNPNLLYLNDSGKKPWAITDAKKPIFNQGDYIHCEGIDLDDIMVNISKDACDVKSLLSNDEFMSHGLGYVEFGLPCKTAVNTKLNYCCFSSFYGIK